VYVLDTDVINAVMRGRLPQHALERIQGLSADRVKITSVTLGELYYGALRTASAKKWLDAVGQLRRRIGCLGFDAEAAEHYGELRSHLESKGRRLDDADLRIAAICRSTGHVLVSGNARHFTRVPGLRFENWLASGERGGR
jgi:tRNA(fMet)-specific endonuclease VapC